MESPLDVATTGEIRRQLAAAKAALTHLETLLAPLTTDETRDASPSGSPVPGQRSAEPGGDPEGGGLW